ncbi:3-oxoacyl-[acyl-carrier-protein] synthase 3 [Jeotgalibacillus campisalis]|uniref:3-oxoacyl-[acyl-carrier-protein] synthase 3 n=2 Tax=Jeotgalibacillus campisalis TaxID=220754 RepID=A0A0C2W978_9BACL|nr:3-oxoacyl-ACP synthase [Jeotgalibacillus campisalis]KIL53141.1 3-oxoacyl-[acyl-carrier-protein] synthase 3 [Jeotgalibacillus campisalis]
MTGIAGVGSYIPNNYMTADQLAEISGVPEAVIREKMGITKKPVAGPEDHTAEMGIQAAVRALEQAGISAKQLDLIIYIGEEHKEYPLWTAGIYIQNRLGATRAWAFDAALRCGTTMMAMKLANDLMAADCAIRYVLLAGGYRNEDFIDYQNQRTRFMFNLASGGGALVLSRELVDNELLGNSIVTDGSFSEDVVVPVGGTKSPLTQEHLKTNRYKLDVMDPEGMKARLEAKSMQNFLFVIRDALEKSGYTQADIDYLGILHMKRSAHDYVLQQLGLTDDQSIYLSDYGHIGQFDQIISLELALARNKIKPGTLVVLVSAGIGYAWAAQVIKWREKE